MGNERENASDLQKYFDDRVIDFYITRSNKNNELGLVIRLEEIKK